MGAVHFDWIGNPHKAAETFPVPIPGADKYGEFFGILPGPGGSQHKAGY